MSSERCPAANAGLEVVPTIVPPALNTSTDWNGPPIDACVAQFWSCTVTRHVPVKPLLLLELSDCAAEIVVAAMTNVNAIAANFKYLQTGIFIFCSWVAFTPAPQPPEHLAQSAEIRPWLASEVFVKVL